MAPKKSKPANSVARRPDRSQVLKRSSVRKPKQANRVPQVPKIRRDKPIKSLRIDRSLFRLRHALVGLGVVAIFALVGGVSAFMMNDDRNQAAQAEQVLSNQSEQPAQVEAPEQQHVREEEVTEADVAKHQTAAGTPNTLSIANMDLVARIQKTSVNMDNRIQLPDNIFDVGWYEGSRKPGEQGVVLLNGYVSGPNERGAFYYLRALEPGDVIEVETGDGEQYRYEVRQSEYVPYGDMKTVSLLVPYEEGKKGLNLVAVDDRFNVMNNDFQDRLVVYAIQL